MDQSSCYGEKVLRISPSLGYVLGYSIGDGYFNFRDGYIEAYTFNEKFWPELKATFKLAAECLNTLPEKIAPRQRPTGTLFTARMRHKTFVRKLVDKSNRLKHDAVICLLGSKLIGKHFVRGLWDAEGTVIVPCKGSPHGRAYIALQDVKLISIIREFLERNYSIYMTASHVAVPQGHLSKIDGREVVTRQNVWRTEIRSPNLNWMRVIGIGLKVPEKHNRVKLILKSYRKGDHALSTLPTKCERFS